MAKPAGSGSWATTHEDWSQKSRDAQSRRLRHGARLVWYLDMVKSASQEGSHTDYFYLEEAGFAGFSAFAAYSLNRAIVFSVNSREAISRLFSVLSTSACMAASWY